MLLAIYCRNSESRTRPFPWRAAAYSVLPWSWSGVIYLSSELPAGFILTSRSVLVVWSVFRGTKELSYLHPENFTPDRFVALRHGLDHQAPNVFMRLGAWGASHDLGLAGWSDEKLVAILEQLEGVCRVHISSGRPFSARATGSAYRGPRSASHHLLAFCNLYLGESATMAAEAAVLGVPAMYDGRDHPCYVRNLEACGLVRTFDGATVTDLLEESREILAASACEWLDKHKAYLAGKQNLAKFVVDNLDTVLLGSVTNRAEF